MISYSRLKAFKTCPKLYFYKYVEKRDPVPTARMLEGKLEHARLVDKNNIPDFFKPAFEKNFLNPIFEEEVEHDFITFKLKGVIDCYSVNNSLACSIVDWKLYNLPSDDEQLKIYALLLSKKYPDLQFFTSYFVSIKGNFYKRFTYNRDDIKDFEEELIAISETILATEEFPCRPGDHCGYCPFIKDCYAENQLPKEISGVAITSVEEAIELAGKVLIAENFLKQVKEQLKTFLLENGLEELKIDDENRIYLSPSISMRFGKIKKSKPKNKRS